MCETKWLLKVLVIGFIVKGCHLISNGNRNGTAEILWNLSRYALKGRQAPFNDYLANRPPPLGIPSGYPFRPSPIPGYPDPQNIAPNYYQPPSPQSFMQALDSIAHNDELRCVPRLLCELTSGSRSSTGRQASFLPFNLNMQSVLGLLSSFDGAEVSPLLLFGRAALLGFTSRDNPSICAYSFPRCPGDADKLVNYLNNYNGGFFRFFTGAPQPYPNGYRDGYNGAEQRIQTKPSQFVASNLKPYYTNQLKSEIKFPGSNEILRAFYNDKSRLTFPENGAFSADRQRYRGAKTLSFPDVVNNELDFQRPLPNHVAEPLIFPTRTGTGQLILDTEAFDYGYNKDNYHSNRISFS